MSTNEQALADRLKADAMAIFNDPPSMTAQEVRDVIEWYDASLRAALTAEQPQSDVQRDAERYRWLINNSFDRGGVTQIHCWLHEWEPHSKTGEPTEWMSRVRGPAIERVIDAEIAKERT